MRIVFSRKGFDTGYGRIPNPILPDGRLFPLPIPYGRGAPIRFGDLPAPWGLEERHATLADFVRSHGARWVPAKGRKPEPITADTIAHLDPDLIPGMLPRAAGWRPLFGQTEAALGHLRRAGVGEGDLFLFFGRFDRLVGEGGALRYEGQPCHLLYGWLQVGCVRPLPDPALPDWARYHPHCVDAPGAPWSPTANALFEAAERLSLPGLDLDLPGAGLFPAPHPMLRLTAPDARAITDWHLPAAFGLPRGAVRTEPTQLARRDWRREGDGFRVNVQGIWQEAVWSLAAFPGALGWLAELFAADVPE
ncbi:hypothetical protein [Azospirillum sp. SYSU D00513]|uniref:Nmad3 family putative nucleotide modification protein n=1 Tax=Azospirillum sp. SYSU D00513 TaxID=2812561 RepID=UPI001A9732D9|nr:hypothetical protein [Azospirillum sp. SYSU D00513]